MSSSAAPETRVFLGLGSNVGARRKQLRAAVSGLAALPGVRLVRCSSLYETEPWGLREQSAFLNCALELHTDTEPLPLLESLQALELQAGRGPGPHGPHWGPRPLDIDILLYGTQCIREPALRVPHAHLHERNFALIPLVELAPELVHPELGLSLRELLARSPDEGAVRRVAGPRALRPARSLLGAYGRERELRTGGAGPAR